MNIEQLNSCFDAMSPTKEQKDRIFAGVMNAKQQPVKIVRFHRYATAAAAVIVIGAFAAVYSNMGTNEITNHGNNPTVAVENSAVKTTVEETVKKEMQVEVLPQTADTQTQDLTNQVAEAYPEVNTELPENEKVAVVEETPVVNDAVDVDNTVEEAMDVAPASAGGGGGGATAYRAIEAESVSLEQIMADEVYGEMFPTAFVDGFKLVSATKLDYNMRAVFEDNEGRYMSVWIINGGTFDFREDVIKPEDVINLKPEYGFFNFALDCDGCYVIYNVESDDANQVYEMVKSSAYFKN